MALCSSGSNFRRRQRWQHGLGRSLLKGRLALSLHRGACANSPPRPMHNRQIWAGVVHPLAQGVVRSSPQRPRAMEDGVPLPPTPPRHPSSDATPPSSWTSLDLCTRAGKDASKCILALEATCTIVHLLCTKAGAEVQKNRGVLGV
jgi:hypothetical protein